MLLCTGSFCENQLTKRAPSGPHLSGSGEGRGGAGKEGTVTFKEMFKKLKVPPSELSGFEGVIEVLKLMASSQLKT